MSSYRTNGEMLKALALGMIAVAGLTAADSARADALRETGFNLSSPLDRNDDGSSASQSLGFTANFFGTDRATAFVNNNGNVSFGSALSTFTASPLSQVRTQIIAPFWPTFTPAPATAVPSAGVRARSMAAAPSSPPGIRWVITASAPTASTPSSL